MFVTARDEVEDRVRGLTVGGDDYVTKPFRFDEIVARMRAILRRRGALRDTTVVSFGDLELDDAAHVVVRGGVTIDLSRREFGLLRFLLAHAGRVVTREQILDAVWDTGFDGKPTIVDTYVSYVRKKLDALGPPLVHTVRGVGYVLRAGSSDATDAAHR